VSIEQHGLNLPELARPAWRAYCDMLNSKDAHFGYLEGINQKYQNGGVRTLAEIARLEQLLGVHDRCVKCFAEAMRALGAANSEAHGALVTAIAELNASLGTSDGGAAN
jgi:bacterioferritin-associated ferredoxin